MTKPTTYKLVITTKLNVTIAKIFIKCTFEDAQNNAKVMVEEGFYHKDSDQYNIGVIFYPGHSIDQIHISEVKKDELESIKGSS